MSIFKDCDIRGVYGKELFEADGYRVGRALSTLVPSARIRVGGDVRLSTPALKARLVEGLVAGGARVEDMGTIATPMMYFAIHGGAADGGAMVTASHNPAKYNGIKFMLGDRPVTREEMDALRAIAESGDFRDGEGGVSPLDILPAYLGSLEARFGTAARGVVVVDAGNGAMSKVAPAAFRQAGYRVAELFCEPDGSFPNRTPNPAEHGQLDALRAKVIEEAADFGVAFDGDGDRAVFVDDRGEAVASERALVLFIRHLLKDGPSAVVYDQKSSSVVRRAILEMGGTPAPERSGHTFIKHRFLDLNAAVAGEVSGHFFFGELGYDDALFAGLLMGEALTRSGRRMSEALADVVCPPITPDLRIPYAYDRQQALLDRLEAAYAGRPISKMDGVRVELEGGWLLMRKSVTAEQMTLRIEGEDRAALERIARDLAKKIPETAAALESITVPA